MTEKILTNAKLLEKIRHVFPVEPIPTQLFRADADMVMPELPGELQKLMFGKPWTALSMADWRMAGTGAHIAVVYLTPQAFRYYLPSLLTVSVEDVTDLEYVLDALLPANKKREPRGDWWHEYFTGFTTDQKDTVIAFLNYVLQTTDPNHGDHFLARQALTDIWQK